MIETVFYQLKNIFQIEHSRYSNRISFMVNVLASLIAYSFKEKNRGLNFFGMKSNL